MAHRYEGSSAEVRALDLYVKLMRAAHAASARIHQHLRAEGLTVRQFAVLEALYHLGPLTQRDLCRKLLTTGGNLTLVVTHLERDGYIQRARPPENRRLVRVDLTPEGRDLVDRLFPRHAAVVARDFSILTANEQRELAHLLKQLGTRRIGT